LIENQKVFYTHQKLGFRKYSESKESGTVFDLMDFRSYRSEAMPPVR